MRKKNVEFIQFVTTGILIILSLWLFINYHFIGKLCVTVTWSNKYISSRNFENYMEKYLIRSSTLKIVLCFTLTISEIIFVVWFWIFFIFIIFWNLIFWNFQLEMPEWVGQEAVLPDCLLFSAFGTYSNHLQNHLLQPQVSWIYWVGWIRY